MTRHFSKAKQDKAPPIGADPDDWDGSPPLSYDERRRNQVFLSDGIPDKFALLGYAAVATLSTVLVPHMFPQIGHRHIAVAYAAAPLLAFCNSYAAGLTDWSLGTVYGKLAIFVVGSWVGREAGGVIAGLVACAVMVVVIGNSGELMHDFKTGYLTLTSPLSMFFSQTIGTALGCVLNPLIFRVFQWLAGEGHLGETGSLYSAPMATAYRGIAVLSVEGVGSLPKHAGTLCAACFATGVGLDVAAAVARAAKWRVHRWVPNPMAMALPFFVGPTFAVDMCVGSLVLIVWRMASRQSAAMLGIVVASGLICGDGLWALPSSLLSILKVQPPICMKFLSSFQSEEMQRDFAVPVVPAA